MLKRLSEILGVPVAALIGISVAGLVVFCLVIGMATFSRLEAGWPEMPFALAVLLAVLAPLVFLLGVGVVGAIHDRWAGDSETAEKVGPPADSVEQQS
jgi:hypothetical protein